MKGSVLWRRITSRYGARLHARGRIGQAGAAMVMALLFILIVTMTSMLLLGVLISQTVPYLKNSQYSQAGYAAESGLQTALSFLRSADKNGDASGLFPAAATGSTANASFQTVGNAVIVKNVEVPQTSGTVTSYTPQKVSYGLKITYYDGDPSGASTTASSERTASSSTGTTVSTAADTGTGTVKQITTSADATSITYAVVVAYGYVVGSDGTFTYGTTTPVRTMSGIYKFGWTAASSSGDAVVSGSSAGNTISYSASMSTSTSSYPLVKIKDGTQSSVQNGSLTFYDHYASSSDTTLRDVIDPSNELCMVAMPNNAGNIGEGSPIRIFRRAYDISEEEIDNGVHEYTVKYSSYCDTSDSTYASRNQWVYSTDNTIRLASSVNSADPLCVTGVGRGTTDVPVTLENCEKESSTRLSKFQTWGYYGSYVNAGFYNGSTFSQGSVDSNSLLQAMYVSPLAASEQTASERIGINLNYCSDDTASDNIRHASAVSCYLYSTGWVKPTWGNAPWKYPSYSTVSDVLAGGGGEDGISTSNIVSSSGTCIWGTWTGVGTRTCIVNPAPASLCDNVLSAQCGTGDGSPPTDNIAYDQGSGTIYQTALSTSLDPWNAFCYYVNDGLLQSRNSTSCGNSADSIFYRTENVGNDDYSYKFVLASSVNNDMDVAQWKQKGYDPQCLTEIWPGVSTYSGVRSDSWKAKLPYVAVESCVASATTVFGQTIYPQIWNGPTPGSSDGSGGSSGGSGTGGGTGADMTPGSGANGFLVTKELSTSAVG